MIERLGNWLDTPEALLLWLALDFLMWGSVLAAVLWTRRRSAPGGRAGRAAQGESRKRRADGVMVG